MGFYCHGCESASKEIDRLRAELETANKAANALSNDLTHFGEQNEELRAENAALRPVVEAAVEFFQHDWDYEHGELARFKAAVRTYMILHE